MGALGAARQRREPEHGVLHRVLREHLATITDALVVERILDHLELPSSPPPMAPARAPPWPEFAW